MCMYALFCSAKETSSLPVTSDFKDPLPLQDLVDLQERDPSPNLGLTVRER